MRAQKGETLKHTKRVLANEILGLEVEVLQKRSKQKILALDQRNTKSL